MIRVQWDAKFELGHERIDFEHHIFLDLIRAVSALDPEHLDREKLARTLTEILKYAEFHFVSEENLMTEIHYPAQAEHCHEHTMLLSQLQDMIKSARTGDGTLENLVDFLFRWFALHTTQVDKRLTSYISAMQETSA